MKKLLRRITVLVCVATLCLMPTTTAMAATSQPVLTTDTDTTKEYTFQPTDYELTPGSSLMLSNAGSLWEVTPEKNFSFACVYNSTTNLRFKLICIRDGGSYVVDTYDACGFYNISIPANTKDAKYMITVYNPSSSTSAFVDSYLAVIE